MEGKEGENPVEEFKASFEQGLEESLEMADFLFDAPRPLDPQMMDIGDRDFESLTADEKEVIQDVLYQALGINPNQVHRQYISESMSQFQRQSGVTIPSRTSIEVSVFQTNRSYQDVEKGSLYLHQMRFADTETRWMLGPDVDA